MLTHAFLVPLIMAVSFVAILAVGKRLPRGGAEIGIAAISLCFVLAVATGVGWVQRVNHPPEAEHATEETAAATDEAAHSGDGAEELGAEAGEEVAAEEGHATEGEAIHVEPDDEIAYAQSSAEPAEEGAHGEEGAAAEEEHAAEAEEHHEVPPVVRKIPWLQTGGFEIHVGTLVDGLSVLMLLVVTLVSGLVHVYSSDYVAGDRRFTHYYAFLSLFTASMLMFVLSQNILQMIVGWELVGLCSFALIGHWWEEKPNSDAALKAFLTNRVGDVGLLVGMIILYFAAGDEARGLIGSFDILRINDAGQHRPDRPPAPAGGLAVPPRRGDVEVGPVPAAHLAARRHGRPDPRLGPHPRRHHGRRRRLPDRPALPGVLARPLDRLVQHQRPRRGRHHHLVLRGACWPSSRATSRRCWPTPPSRQLGYMVMALGVGAWTAGLFHLFTHAMFKACLFLGAGSVSHACHHTFDMQKIGGLRKHMPRTYRTFLIGTAALAGLFPLAGFWSKDEILAGANQPAARAVPADARRRPHRRLHAPRPT